MCGLTTATSASSQRRTWRRARVPTAGCCRRRRRQQQQRQQLLWRLRRGRDSGICQGGSSITPHRHHRRQHRRRQRRRRGIPKLNHQVETTSRCFTAWKRCAENACYVFEYLSFKRFKKRHRFTKTGSGQTNLRCVRNSSRNKQRVCVLFSAGQGSPLRP